MAGITKITGFNYNKEGFRGHETERVEPNNGWFVLAGWVEVDEEDIEYSYPPNFSNMSEDAVAAFFDQDTDGRLILEILGLQEGDVVKEVTEGEDRELDIENDGFSSIQLPVELGQEFIIRREEWGDIQFQIRGEDEV